MFDAYKSLPKEAIKFEVDQFIQRLSNVYYTPEFKAVSPRIFKDLHAIVKLPLAAMPKRLEALATDLDALVQKHAKPILMAISAEKRAPVSGGSSNGPDVWGPPLWKKLHDVAKKDNLGLMKTAFEEVLRDLPCSICRAKLDSYLKENPIEKPLDFYVWTLHNYVNMKLGKPLFPG
jgi:hypothetical protein